MSWDVLQLVDIKLHMPITKNFERINYIELINSEAHIIEWHRSYRTYFFKGCLDRNDFELRLLVDTNKDESEEAFIKYMTEEFKNPKSRLRVYLNDYLLLANKFAHINGVNAECDAKDELISSQ